MSELANPTLWRTRPQKVLGYLYVDDPPVVYSRRVNQATFSYPINYVEYDNPDANSGTHTNVLDGMTIKVSSSGGVFKAFLRAKPSGDHQLYFGHVSRGECEFADNDRLEVMDDYRPFAKIPFIEPTGVIRKDWNNYYDGENLNPLPVANAGVWYAGFINPTTVSVPFTPTASFAVDDGGSLPSQAWAFPGGTPSSATTANHAGVTFSQGRRWVLKTVTDNNGNTHTAKALIATLPRTGAGSPTPVAMASLQGSVENGWTARFELLGTNLTESDFPDGSPVIFFTEEKRGSTSGSLAGQAGREHVKFCGWIVGLETTANSDGTSDLMIECAGPLAYMKTNPAFDQVLERATTPDNWQQMANLNWWKALLHWLYWHSTLLEITDIEQSPYYDALPAMFLPARAGSLYDQIQFVCEATNGNFTCDKQGIFYARRWPQTMTDAEKATLDTIVDLDAADWTGEIQLGRKFRDKVGWLRGYAVVASTSAVLGAAAIAPGDTPGQGVSQDTLDQWLVLSQSEFNTRLGRMFAYRNSDDDPIQLSIMNMGGVADPAWQEWVTFTLSSGANKRGINYSGARFWLTNVTIAYDWRNGTSQERWTLDREVGGSTATTVNLPSEDDGTDITSQPPPDWTPPPEIIPGVIGDDGTGAEIISGVAVAWGNPTLITIDRQNPGWAVLHDPTGEITQSVVGDEYSPYYATGRGNLNLYALTDAALYRIINALGPSPTITEQEALVGFTLLRLVRGVNGGIAAYGAREYSTSETLFDTVVCDSTNDTPSPSDATTLTSTYRIVVTGLYEVDTLGGGAGAFNDAFYSQWPTPGGAWNGPFDQFEMDGAETVDPLPAFDAGHTYEFFRDGTGSPFTFRIDDSDRGDNDGALTFTIYVTGLADAMAIANSSNSGATVNYIQVGTALLDGPGAFDADDFNLGTYVAVGTDGTGAELYCTQEYNDTVGDLISGVTNAGSGVEFNLVRIPYRRFGGTTLNNDATALRVLWGADDEVSGETLWWGLLNTTTNTMSSITAVTPNDGSENFAPIGPNCLEILASNPDIWVAFMAGVTSGDVWRLRTEDAGATWDFLEMADYSHIQWGTSGNQSLWFAGADGIGKTDDRGDTDEDRTGDAQIVSSITTFRGAFSIR